MRKLCWFALPFCAAILAACYGLPSVLPFAFAGALAGILAGCLKRRPVCLACFGLAVGLLWFQGYTLLVRAPAEHLAGQTAPLQGTVLDFPQELSTGSYAVDVRLHLEDAPDTKVLLYADQTGANLRPGDTISCTARFQLANTVQGESVSYYEARGIFLRANAVATLSTERPDKTLLCAWPAYLSRALKRSAAEFFPEDVSGLIAALLTGDKSGLSRSDYTVLQRSGAAHIVAVSGLHLSFFAGLLALIFRRRSKLGAGLTIALMFLYAAVAGFTPSVTRAAFMISMTMLAPLLGRENDPPTTLSTALLLLLIANPYAAQSVSLQLSFSAVAGIYLISGRLHQAITKCLSEKRPLWHKVLRRVFRIIAANLSVTLGAMIFTVPLTAIHFGSVALVSPLTNLMTLWAVSGAFFLALPMTILGALLPGLPTLLAFPATLLGRYILAAGGLLSRLPFASVSMDSFYLRAWLVLVYLLILLVFLRRYRRPILPVCTSIITLCAALVFTRASLLSASLSAVALDVGQGQCILLCSGGRTALVDCGGNEGNAGDIAADYLQTLGISRLDLLVLTHCHSDHANGVPELMERIKMSALVMPELAEDDTFYRDEILAAAGEHGITVTLLNDNRTLSFGESTLTLYAPLSDDSTNEAGLFALASCADFDLLITGDAGSLSESLLVKYGHLPDIEVLAAGHHGSKHSTSNLLLDAVTPETCLISCGYNTYGHPADETLTRLDKRGIDVYRTDLQGHISIRYKGE